MAIKVIILAIFLAFNQGANAQSLDPDPEIPKFMGRKVTVVEPETDPDGFPKGPASVCIEEPPQRQCYTAPKDFGRHASLRLIQVKKDMPALFFYAASGGASGFTVHLALLRPGALEDLRNLFPSDLEISSDGMYEIWEDPRVSDSPFFVTADFVWGMDEGHYGPHRYTISAYVLKYSPSSEDFFYELDDRYLTARRYDLEDADQGLNLLDAERAEIIDRLMRVKAARH